MSDRYWVGGTTTWNGTASTKWATTSGGVGGASEPTSSDNVIFDANSGTAVVTLSNNRPCLALTTTNFTGSFTNGSVVPQGTITLGAGMTWGSSTQTTLYLTSAITSNGVVLDTISASTGLILNDPLTCGKFVLNNGTINLTNDVTCTHFIAEVDSKTTRNLTMNSSTITITSGLVTSDFRGVDTLSAGSGTIKCTSTTGGILELGDKTYGTLWFGDVSSGSFTIKGSNTIATLKADPGSSLKFATGTTQTITTFDIDGTSGHLVTLQSSSAGNTWSVSKASGTVTVDYVDLTDSIATGGAAFSATNSVDSGNNTGWSFSATEAASNQMFLVM